MFCVFILLLFVFLFQISLYFISLITAEVKTIFNTDKFHPTLIDCNRLLCKVIVGLRQYLLRTIFYLFRYSIVYIEQPPENICQTGFWQTRLVLLVDLEASNDLIYII